MSEHGPRVQYHGVPERERPSRDAARLVDVQGVLKRFETFGYRIPEAWMPTIDEAIASVERVAAAAGTEAKQVRRDRIFLVRDTLYTFSPSDADTQAEFRAASDSIAIRAEHFFSGSDGEQGIFQKKREEEYGFYRRDFIRIFNDPAELEQADRFSAEVFAVAGYHALFGVNEVLDAFFSIPPDQKQVRAMVLEREPELRRLFPAAHARIGEAMLGVLSRNQKKMNVFGEIILYYSEKEALSRIVQSPELVITPEVKITLAHELAHAMSHVALSEFPTGSGPRVGYKIPGKNAERYFVSLNEACTETIAQEAVDGTLGETSMFETRGSYRNDRLLLQAIIRRIAANGENFSDVWKRFKRGMFTGELMHLRDIQKTFGEDAWNVYKALTPDQLRKPSKATRAKVKKLFGVELEK